MDVSFLWGKKFTLTYHAPLEQCVEYFKSLLTAARKPPLEAYIDQRERGCLIHFYQIGKGYEFKLEKWKSKGRGWLVVIFTGVILSRDEQSVEITVKARVSRFQLLTFLYVTILLVIFREVWFIVLPSLIFLVFQLSVYNCIFNDIKQDFIQMLAI